MGSAFMRVLVSLKSEEGGKSDVLLNFTGIHSQGQEIAVLQPRAEPTFVKLAYTGAHVSLCPAEL